MGWFLIEDAGAASEPFPFGGRNAMHDGGLVVA
jgi:hypothetical protein